MGKSIVKSSIAYQQIRDGILSGKYPPGSRLVLADLQRDFKLGQGAVRDAILQLDKSGLVTNLPYKGATVNLMPSVEELECLYQAKITLELFLARIAMGKITKSKLQSLQKMIDASIKDIDMPQKFFVHDRKFHNTLYAVSNMTHVTDVLDNLQDHINIFLNTNMYSYDYRKKSIESHQDMLDALCQKNEKLLEESLRYNIELGIEYIRNKINGNKIYASMDIPSKADGVSVRSEENVSRSSIGVSR